MAADISQSVSLRKPPCQQRRPRTTSWTTWFLPNEILFTRALTSPSTALSSYLLQVGHSKCGTVEYIFQSFMGGQQSVVMHNTCEDSLLASPLILDLAIVTKLYSAMRCLLMSVRFSSPHVTSFPSCRTCQRLCTFPSIVDSDGHSLLAAVPPATIVSQHGLRQSFAIFAAANHCGPIAGYVESIAFLTTFYADCTGHHGNGEYCSVKFAASVAALSQCLQTASDSHVVLSWSSLSSWQVSFHNDRVGASSRFCTIAPV